MNTKQMVDEIVDRSQEILGEGQSDQYCHNHANYSKADWSQRNERFGQADLPIVGGNHPSVCRPSCGNQDQLHVSRNALWSGSAACARYHSASFLCLDASAR